VHGAYLNPAAHLLLLSSLKFTLLFLFSLTAMEITLFR
jgi:hypothetical protein